jgi:hypothetical protein
MTEFIFACVILLHEILLLFGSVRRHLSSNVSRIPLSYSRIYKKKYKKKIEWKRITTNETFKSKKIKTLNREWRLVLQY